MEEQKALMADSFQNETDLPNRYNTEQKLESELSAHFFLLVPSHSGQSAFNLASCRRENSSDLQSCHFCLTPV